MVVRFVIYGSDSGAECLETAREWAQEQADDLRQTDGVERVTFVWSRDPPRVGAVMVFASEDDLARYKETGPFRWILDRLPGTWLGEDPPVREEAYRALDV